MHVEKQTIHLPSLNNGLFWEKQMENLIYQYFNQSKYTSYYISIISKIIKDRPSLKYAKEKYGYIEQHHIIPRSIDKTIEKEKNNLVNATAREHFILHKLLVKMTIGTKYHYKMLIAVCRFVQNGDGQHRVLSARDCKPPTT